MEDHPVKEDAETANAALDNPNESRKTLAESMTRWLQVFKFPSVERKVIFTGTQKKCLPCGNG